MKFLTILSALALTCRSIVAHPLQDDLQQDSGLEERQSSVVYLTGGKQGNLRIRQEVRQLKDTSPNQWNLFLLTMRQMQLKATSDPTGYYGISGIHGVPRVSYNGRNQCGSCGGADGYCTHDSVLFPSWHRAYVALFEQEFRNLATQLADSFTTDRKSAMQGAARNIRLPYFDWAARPGNYAALPSMFTDDQVTVDGPTGRQSFTNPLLRYDFKNNEQSQMYYGPFTTWPRTYRYPNSNNNNAVSNQQQAASAFQNIRQNLQDQMYQLFTQCGDYLSFSNDVSSQSAGCSNSLEAIHNTVHNAVGGGGSNGVSGGHMTYLPLGSFDPIFWMHHVNVDRYFAIWQGLHPNAYGASQQAPHNTWTIPQGSTQDANSCLEPFLSAANTCWTTNQVRDWRTFGYDYPEFYNSDRSVGAITNYVNNLYGPNGNAVAGSSKREADPEAAGQSKLFKALGDILPGNPLVANNGSSYQYVANIKTPRYSLGKSYTVFLFNGKPQSEDPSTWITDPNLYGPMGVTAMPGMEGANVTTVGSVPLTRKLQETVTSQRGILGSLSELLVAPFLTKQLEWRISSEGKAVSPDQLPGFVVSVVTSSAKPSSDPNSFPVFSDFIELLDVTKGQAGGANSTLYNPSY
jgi:tyrosinase